MPFRTNRYYLHQDPRLALILLLVSALGCRTSRTAFRPLRPGDTVVLSYRAERGGRSVRGRAILSFSPRPLLVILGPVNATVARARWTGTSWRIIRPKDQDVPTEWQVHPDRLRAMLNGLAQPSGCMRTSDRPLTYRCRSGWVVRLLSTGTRAAATAIHDDMGWRITAAVDTVREAP